MLPSLLRVSALLLLASLGFADGRYPGRSWDIAASTEVLGYDQEALGRARQYSETIRTAAVVVVVDGMVLTQWGEVSRKYNVHSIRKSFLSAMYGVHVAEGRIDTALSMEALGVDDKAPSLDERERGATIDMLLKARSGIYHAALYETASMAARRPPRGSHAPDTFWYYNNWDFNALGTIFRNLTRTDIFQEFERVIADPIGMEDFDLADGTYVTGNDSVHPAYPFRMTARDLARFGLLFLREGKWEDRVIVPSEWVKASVTSYSDAGESGGYGYMWWVADGGKHLPTVTLEEGSFSARGAGGHHILVLPARDMVIVHRVDTDVPGNQVSSEEFGNLVRLILESRAEAP